MPHQSALSDRVKTAIKTALATVLAYGVALSMDWKDAHWAAFAVAFCTLSTVGKSVNKGLLRLSGTLVGGLRNSKAVGAVFGLTPSRYQSGEVNRTGAISRCGDEMMRVMLYEAAHTMLLRLAKWSWLKAWAMKIARQRGIKKAIVALARRLAVIMHRIWVDGTEFRWTRESAAA